MSRSSTPRVAGIADPPSGLSGDSMRFDGSPGDETLEDGRLAHEGVSHASDRRRDELGGTALESGSNAALVVREVVDTEDLHECEAIQVEAWGYGDLETVPASQLRAVQQAAGMVLGAYRGDLMVGFAYGFLARDLERMQRADEGDNDPRAVGLHSHLVAVRPGLQGTGVGRSLKWGQRQWCLERGLEWMHWTFDPLQVKNARLNLHHLGGSSRTYLVDFYGVISGPLSGDQATDRLLLEWDLRSPAVVERATRFVSGQPPEDVPRPPGHHLLALAPDGSPDVRDLPTSTPPDVLMVDAPHDITRLFHEEPDRAASWRLAVRDAMVAALGRGYRVTSFAQGAYVLERTATTPKASRNRKPNL